jgi:hypothetical protein
LIDENDLYVQGKETYSFLVLPNASIAGFNLTAEVVVLDGGATYLKKRDPIQLGLMVDPKETSFDRPVEIFLRDSDKKEEIDVGNWYEVSEDGSSLRQMELNEEGHFYPGELLTRRISSIMIARELMLRMYSTFMFEELKDPQIFAELYGFRLWGRLNPIYNQDLFKRVEFLKKYTRREESKIYLFKKKFFGASPPQLSNKYFIEALDHFYKKREMNENEFEKILYDPGK